MQKWFSNRAENWLIGWCKKFYLSEFECNLLSPLTTCSYSSILAVSIQLYGQSLCWNKLNLCIWIEIIILKWSSLFIIFYSISTYIIRYVQLIPWTIRTTYVSLIAACHDCRLWPVKTNILLDILNYSPYTYFVI